MAVKAIITHKSKNARMLLHSCSVGSTIVGVEQEQGGIQMGATKIMFTVPRNAKQAEDQTKKLKNRLLDASRARDEAKNELQKAESLVVAIQGILKAYEPYLPQSKQLFEAKEVISAKPVSSSPSIGLEKGTIKTTVVSVLSAFKDTGITTADLIKEVSAKIPQANKRSIGATISALKNRYDKKEGKFFWKA